MRLTCFTIDSQVPPCAGAYGGMNSHRMPFSRNEFLSSGDFNKSGSALDAAWKKEPLSEKITSTFPGRH